MAAEFASERSGTLQAMTETGPSSSFEYDELRTGFFDSACIAQQLIGAGLRLALHLETAERVHRLRREPDVRAHGHGTLDEEPDRRREPLAAFDLDHLRTRAHHFDGTRKRIGRRTVAAEGQIGHDQPTRLRACDAGRVVGDIGERDG